jgi:ribonuclease T2
MGSALPRRLARQLALLALLALPLQAAAEERIQGPFDHFILALTWMPSFCALEGAGRDDRRCAPGADHGWLVHGLWPQHPGGRWPEYCPTEHRDPSRRETAAQVALYGAPGPAWHQWTKHGRCTGLDPEDYYALTAEAVAQLALPPLGSDTTVTLPPDAVEAAFIASNPGLTGEMMIATCRRGMIVELRLCLTRGLEPRPCDAEMAERACPLEAARFPARQGGASR